MTDEEYARVVEKADRAGIATAAFLRSAALGDSGPRAQRRPPADHVALRKLLGELGRIGNNINQIAHRLNTGEPPHVPELRRALATYLILRNAILKALGMETAVTPPGPPPVPAPARKQASHDHQGM